MELDIFIPTIKIGIEYDGERAHTERTFEKDSRKYSICREHGIRLIRIRETAYSGDIPICDIQIKSDYTTNYLTAVDLIIEHLERVLGFTVDHDTDRDRIKILEQIKSKLDTRSLSVEYPELFKEWNYERNGVALMKVGGAALDDSYQMNVYPRGAYGDDYVYANVFMWDQNWENPVFVSNSGSVSEMTLVTESDFMFDIAQKEIFDFYKVQSTTLSGDDSYSWNPNKARHLFRVYSDKKKDGGRVEVIDRFGNVYSAKVSW
jgi:hypothetical protein